MRQVWITRPGPPNVLQVREAPDPTASEGQVRIAVRAAGINFADLMARVGLYPDAPKLPCVVGYEVSGVVDQVGAGVKGFREGDRVFAMPRFGGYTDVLAVAAKQVVKMPDAMTFEEGAALPVVYLTAHTMMMFTGHLREGSRILIHSAAGGVGLAAIQLAVPKKCVIFGTASAGKHALLRDEGCQYPIDSNGDVKAQVRAKLKEIGATGVDLVLDAVGGKSWTDGYDLLDPCGRLVCFGLSAAASGNSRNLFHALGQVLQIKRWNPMKLMDDNKTISGCNMGHLFGRPDMLLPQFESLVAMYNAGTIKPRVDATFPFSRAAEAHQHIHDRKAVGKVLLTPD